MKPAPFDYVAPETLDETLMVLAEHGSEAKLLAGGQSLIPVMNFRLAQPSLIVDLNGVTGLDVLEQTADGNLRLGAMVRQRRLERDPLVAQQAPLIYETMPYIAHPQIRNRGTVGGSLAHADPAGELPLISVAMEARLRLQRMGSERWVNAEDFFIGLFTVDLEPEEMVTEVVVPPLPAGTGYAFMEVARRHGDYAQAGVAALVTLNEHGTCDRARLVYLNVGEVPIVARRAATLLVGEALSLEVIETAADVAATEEIEPVNDIHATADYKRHLTRVLTVRALQQAVERASAGDSINFKNKPR